mgnify:CR=1 FL=1
MNIRQVTDGKEDYIELLRAGDPDESRIRKLLEKGELLSLIHISEPTRPY